MCRRELWPDPPRSLANHLKKIRQSQSKSFIGIEIGARLSRGKLERFLGHVQHMADVDEVILRHTEAALRRGYVSSNED